MRYYDGERTVKTKKHFFEEHVYGLMLFFISIAIVFFLYSRYYYGDELYTYLPNIVGFSKMQGLKGLRVPFRVPLLVFAAIPYKIFGSIDAINYGFVFVFPITVMVMYWIGYIINGRRAGLLIGLLAMCNPIVYQNSAGLILPDNIASLFVVLSYLTLFLYINTDKIFSKILLIVFTAFFCFCTYLMKEPYLLLFIGFFFIAAYYLKTFKKVLILSLSVGGVFAAMFIAYKMYLLSIGIAFTFEEFPVAQDPEYMIRMYSYFDELYGLTSVGDHFIHTLKIIFNNPLYIFEAIICVIASLYGIIKKNYIYLGLTLSSISMILMFGLYVLSYDPYIGGPVDDRYFIPVYLLFSICAGWFLIDASKQIFKKYHKYVVYSFIVIALLAIPIMFFWQYTTQGVVKKARETKFDIGTHLLIDNVDINRIVCFDHESSKIKHIYKYDKDYDGINFLRFQDGHEFAKEDGMIVVGVVDDAEMWIEAEKFAKKNSMHLIKQIVKTNGTKDFLKGTPIFGGRGHIVTIGYFIECDD